MSAASTVLRSVRLASRAAAGGCKRAQDTRRGKLGLSRHRRAVAPPGMPPCTEKRAPLLMPVGLRAPTRRDDVQAPACAASARPPARPSSPSSTARSRTSTSTRATRHRRLSRSMVRAWKMRRWPCWPGVRANRLRLAHPCLHCSPHPAHGRVPPHVPAQYRGPRALLGPHRGHLPVAPQGGWRVGGAPCRGLLLVVGRAGKGGHR